PDDFEEIMPVILGNCYPMLLGILHPMLTPAARRYELILRCPHNSHRLAHAASIHNEQRVPFVLSGVTLLIDLAGWRSPSPVIVGEIYAVILREWQQYTSNHSTFHISSVQYA
ncbi:hypothetical protein, partial [Effusibacillus pohliae]|uniref:hypothetical protein n=1 Tax=Effusibacillus pohliae TaxID=232270 RepID=UPI0014615A37